MIPFDVISIFVWVKDETKLQGFTKDDFDFLSSKIYPTIQKPTISWKNPIEQLMKTIVTSPFEKRAFFTLPSFLVGVTPRR